MTEPRWYHFILLGATLTLVSCLTLYPLFWMNRHRISTWPQLWRTLTRRK